MYQVKTHVAEYSNSPKYGLNISLDSRRTTHEPHPHSPSPSPRQTKSTICDQPGRLNKQSKRSLIE
ncbi:hypothetical protein DPMN_013810 [Dreissena polymorpha]|uniref:Uncharacterized protein n=1 Tax=Dreissena polymorpha TaxID=45954 RepID=A0A9D4N8A9_DREPO|nr:hypothetical protein DPMN_013810 [Dreissena polymorpha]